MNDVPLEIVRDMFAMLERDGIDYCHWKSNESLDRAMSGEGDLDLLVDPRHRFAFGKCMQRLGFKKAVGSRDRHSPGIVHYYGQDSATGRIVDLHVHRSLLVGSDLLKNYELAMRPLLDSAQSSGQHVRVPAPEYEYVLFVTRMVLKRRLLPWVLGYPDPRLPAKTLLARGRPGLTGSEKREYEYLSGRIHRERIGEALAAVIPAVGEELFTACETSLEESARWSWLPVGARLARALRPHRRRGVLASIGRAVLARVGYLARSQRQRFPFLASERRPRLSCRGPVIAFVGGDGAGKTTGVRALERALGETFHTKTFHLGKPPFGPVRLSIRIASKTLRLVMGNKQQEEVASLLALRYVGIARSRLQLVKKARRFANGGGIAICDRYPIHGLALSEGPLVAGLATKGSRVMKWLVKLEQTYYERIEMQPQPDRIFVLTLDPAVSIRRKPEDDPQFIRPRLEEIRNHTWADQDNVLVVDAGQPLESVLRLVRSEAWALLPSWSPQVELAGPAGSGKSTLAAHMIAADAVRPDGVTTLRGAKRRLAWRGVQAFPAALRVGVADTAWLVRKQVLLDLWASRTPQSELPVLYDQGPYFTLAFSRWRLGDASRSRLVDPWYRRYRRGTDDLVDLVVLLDAPDHVLMERVSDRDQDHLVKSSSPDAQMMFLASSRADLREAIDGVSGTACTLVEISSHGTDPAVLTVHLKNLLQV